MLKSMTKKTSKSATSDAKTEEKPTAKSKASTTAAKAEAATKPEAETDAKSTESAPKSTASTAAKPASESVAKPAPKKVASGASASAKTVAKTDAKKDEPTKTEADATQLDKPTDDKSAAAEKAKAQTTNLSFSSALYNFLATRNISLAFTSYQTGNLYILGHGLDKKLALHQVRYPQAMGVVGDGRRIYLASLNQIVRLENVIGPNQLANERHDKVYVPRNFQTVGAVDLHEIGVRKDGRVVFVNTKYSCLCELSLKHSFKPIWKPTFISKLAAEDRCHLNGLAMKDGEPKYVSAVCKSDVVDGWRDRRDSGGIIIDIETDEIVAEGLSMPHSPRVYDGKLWVANSGSGEIGWIDEKTKKFKPVAFCPGFIRGLSFVDGYAVVTLSKPRYKRFDGLELASKLEEKDADPWCGVQIISLSDGSVAHWIRFDGAIQELFDVCVLPGVKDALTVAPHSAEFNNFVTFEDLVPARETEDA